MCYARQQDLRANIIKMNHVGLIVTVSVECVELINIVQSTLKVPVVPQIINAIVQWSADQVLLVLPPILARTGSI